MMFRLSLGQTRWWLGLVALALCMIFCGSCVSPNSNPVISSLEAEKELVDPSGSCRIECVASDADGDSLTYTWSASKGDFSGVDGGNPVATWMAPDTLGTYNIIVRVTDGRGGESMSSLSIKVALNNPPTVSLEAEKELVVPSGSCRIECVASDPDGDSLTYTWSASKGSFSGADGGNPVATWIAPDTPDICTITVKVTDGRGGEGISSLSIKVVPNNPPTISELIVTIEEQRYLKEYSEGYRIFNGKSCDIKCVASDPESDELVYEWLSDGGNVSGEGPAVIWTAPLRAGEFTIEVTASDSSGGTATESVVFKVETCACAF